MIRSFMTAAASAAVLTLSSTTFAGGTGEEAKAMLTKAVAAVKADEAKALDQFNKGEGGFLEGDLYVFCAQASDGKIVALANQNAKQLIGTDQRALKDSTGKEYGKELFAAAQKPGRIIHGGQIFVSTARSRSETGSEGEPCNQGQRSRLRRRLLSIVSGYSARQLTGRSAIGLYERAGSPLRGPFGPYAAISARNIETKVLG